MTRKKVKLAYITNDSARKATFKKRKKGLVKKVSELSTLCGVDACVIIYSPYDSQPEVWPPSPERVVARFKGMPEMEQSKKMVNQESFLKHRLAKATDQLKKLGKDNREKEITCFMYRTLTLSASSPASCPTAGGGLLQGLSIVDLNDLGWIIDQTLKDIQNRMDSLFETFNRIPSPRTCSGGPAVFIENNTAIAAAEVAAEEEEEETKRVELVGLGGGLLESEITTTTASASSSGAVVDEASAALAFHNNNVNNNTLDEDDKQQWLMDLLQSNDHMGMGFGGGEEEMMMPFGFNGLWSTAFFP